MKRLSLFLLLVAASAGASAQSTTYQIDPTHTDVIASWNHFGFSNPSLHVGNASGTIVFDESNPGKSQVSVKMPLSALNTHVPKLDEHLASADFFDTSRFPSATFKSVHIQDKGHGAFDIHGELTIRGITKPATLHAKLNKAGLHPMTKKPTVGFEATGKIKRSDYGMTSAIPAVSDEIKLRITTEASASQ